MTNVVVTYPFEEWPPLGEPDNPTQKESSETPSKVPLTPPLKIRYVGSTLAVEYQEAVDQVIEDHHNDPIPIDLDTDTSVPFCFETFVQGIGNLDIGNRKLTQKPQDSSDEESAGPHPDEGGRPLDMETVCSSHRNDDCYCQDKEGCHWVNLGQYSYTKYQCDPGDSLVIDTITRGARLLPSLLAHIYSQKSPPADEGLAPSKEMIHQCPDDIPIGHE